LEAPVSELATGLGAGTRLSDVGVAEELATRFFSAAEEGDLEALEEPLAHDVVLRGAG
jgi:hypothetical protein